jgi:V-type H+-transporting ATPase subunit C
MQVPRSSAVVAEDNDYALVTVVLFKRVVDDFKAAARSKGYQVGEPHLSLSRMVRCHAKTSL